MELHVTRRHDFFYFCIEINFDVEFYDNVEFDVLRGNTSKILAYLMTDNVQAFNDP